MTARAAPHPRRTSGARTTGWRRVFTPERRRKLGPWLAVAFLALVGWLIADHVREVDWPAVREAIAAYPMTMLAAAIGCVVASHAIYACYDLLAKRYVGHRVPAPAVLATAFVSYAFNLNLGAAIGGFGFRIRLYSKLGLCAAEIGRIIAFSLVTNWSGWLLLAGATFALRQIPLPESFPVGASALQAIGVAMTIVPIAYVAACFFSRKREWHWRTHEFVLPNGPLALGQLALSCASWLVIGMILWALMPRELGYGSVLATLLGAAIVGAAAHVPGGLGVIEAVFVASLGSRVPAPQLIAALLAYRALYYLAPLVVAAAMHFGIEAAAKRRRSA
jgi:glycosyltransferase 2 family protein